MKLLRAIFYRFYQLQIYVGNKDSSRIAAIFGMVMVFVWNFFTLIFLSYLFIGKHVSLPKLELATIYMIPVAILYFLFVRKSQFEEILNTYKGEPEIKEREGKRNAFLYIISSFFMLLTSLFLVVLKNNGKL